MQESIRATTTLRMEVRDAAGRLKPVWQENKLGAWLLQHGFPATWRIPGLGKWQAYKELTWQSQT